MATFNFIPPKEPKSIFGDRPPICFINPTSLLRDIGFEKHLDELGVPTTVELERMYRSIYTPINSKSYFPLLPTGA